MRYYITTDRGNRVHTENGSYEYPFVATPTRTLDEILMSLPEYSDIRLMPGPYWMNGRVEGGPGMIPKRGWTISSHDREKEAVTIALRYDNHPEGRLVGAFLCDYNTPCDDFEISDITFDLNSTRAGRHAMSAVGVVGDRIKIQNCRATDYGNGCEAGKSESFIFSIGAGPKNAVRNEIRDCICGDPGPLKSANTTCFIVGGTAAGMERWSVAEAVIDGCKAFSKKIGPGYYTVGASVSLCGKGLIQNCKFDGMRFAVYQDSWNTEIVNVEHCLIMHASSGVYLRFQPNQGGQPVPLGRAIISQNWIGLNHAWENVSGVAITSDQNTAMIGEECQLIGNLIRWEGDSEASHNIWGMGVKLMDIASVGLVDNQINLPGAIYGAYDFINCPDVWGDKNRPELSGKKS